MQFRMFQAGHGQCFLLTNSNSTAHVLFNGGTAAAYRAHVAPFLEKLSAAGGKLNLVCVSDVDNGHMGGILELLQGQVARRAFPTPHPQANSEPIRRRQRSNPTVRALWHNSFAASVGQDAAQLSAAVWRASALGSARLEQSSDEFADAILASELIDSCRSTTRFNGPAKGRLLLRASKGRRITLNGMTITILGPSQRDLKRLRSEWNAWFKEWELSSDRSNKWRTIDRRWTLFPQPLMSLTLFIEQGPQSVLLTGNAREHQIVEGLAATGRVRTSPLSVDVLTVPHYGDEHNLWRMLYDAVEARHYIFSGSGMYGGPDPTLVQEIAIHRANSSRGKFTFWFSNNPDPATQGYEHMRRVRKVATKVAKAIGNRMAVRFVDQSSRRVL